jgi:hypothetical protein
MDDGGPPKRKKRAYTQNADMPRGPGGPCGSGGGGGGARRASAPLPAHLFEGQGGALSPQGQGMHGHGHGLEELEDMPIDMQVLSPQGDTGDAWGGSPEAGIGMEADFELFDDLDEAMG